MANVSIENEALERALDVKELNPAVADINYGDVYVGSDHVTFENVQWIVSTPPFFEDYWGLGEVYETFRAQISATSCLPRELHVGDTLPDENYRALYIEEPTELGEDPSEKRYREYIKERGITLPENDNREVKAVIRNRHVEAQERVKVPAGEWECWKISYEVVGPIEKIVGYPTREQFEAAGIYRYQRPGDEMPVTTKYIDYISPEVGLVKRDKFNFRGKRVEESLVLESLK